MCDYDDYVYDGHYDNKLDYFDYDDPVDFDSYPVCMVLLGRIIMSCIMICMAWMTVGYIVYHGGNVGVVPYWSGDEEGDVCEGDVALSWTGSDEPVDMLGYSVVSTFGRVAQVAPVMRKAARASIAEYGAPPAPVVHTFPSDQRRPTVPVSLPLPRFTT